MSGASCATIAMAPSICCCDCASSCGSTPIVVYISVVASNASFSPSSCACHGSMPMRKKMSAKPRSLPPIEAARPEKNVRVPEKSRRMHQPSTTPVGANARNKRNASGGPAKRDSTAIAATAAAMPYFHPWRTVKMSSGSAQTMTATTPTSGRYTAMSPKTTERAARMPLSVSGVSRLETMFFPFYRSTSAERQIVSIA